MHAKEVLGISALILAVGIVVWFGMQHEATVPDELRTEEVSESTGAVKDGQDEKELQRRAETTTGDTACDPAVLEAQLAGVMSAFESSLPTQTGSEAMRDEEGGYYGRIDGAYVHACEFTLQFEGTVDSDAELAAMHDAIERLKAHLRASGWDSSYAQEIHVGVRERHLTLAHADGPLSSQEIFARTVDGAVQFLPVRLRTQQKHRDAYMSGGLDDPCPCTMTVDIGITRPIRVSEL